MELSDVAPLDHDEPQEPVMLDLYAGTNAPLAQAFNWCGWKVVTPIDLERDPDLDISRASVRKAIYRLLSGVQFIACAMSCATKSRARERQPGPKQSHYVVKNSLGGCLISQLRISAGRPGQPRQRLWIGTTSLGS